jgi:DNA invertase Pin-like site-specific DNA recombinase
MPKRRYQQPNSDNSTPELPGTLPIHQPVAVYYRQSTDAQIGNISTTIQTVDMVEYLKQRGWAESDILMIDMDAGVSGTKKIDERQGMRRLFELITTRQIGAVACQDEDRLFRDVTQIQVNIFIEACRASNVCVITPSVVYDFAHKDMGTFHARQFRFKSEMAAEYIQSYIRGRLHRARERLMMEGRWAGGSVPPGFMIDMRKELPNGSKN